ncbi:MAG: response regulator transcription factor [Bacteroidota bacterium]
MTDSKNIEIAIIEDLCDIAFDLKNTLNNQEEFSCNQIFTNAEDAVTFLPKSPVDIVIVDIGLPGISGIEAITRLKEKMPNTQFCMYTIFEDDEKIFQSINAGAKGYLLKNTPTLKIIEAIKELYNGGSPLSPKIARKLIDSFVTLKTQKEDDEPQTLPLTKREYELLSELANGLLYKEISVKLGITIGSVKQHIHKIYEKLQVTNRTEAINRYFNRE